nr:PQQ-dependent sugar dehydrogenase [uncultured Acidocella sp.]
MNRLLILLLVCLPVRALAAPPYHPQGICAGFPRLDLASLPGTCVGLVAKGLRFPRGIAVAGHDVYVVEMGGWVKGRGALLRFADDGKAPPQTLLTGLDEPNGIAIAPDGTIYLGLLGRVARLRLAGGKATLEDVITFLPDTGRHPLTALVVEPDGALDINIGSATNNCEGPGKTPPNPAKPCPETAATPPRASIARFMPQPGKILRFQDAQILATGLRNAIGLAILPDGKLAAAVNARDFINLADPHLSDENEPRDTLDIIKPGADYGWPYCFDENRPSPEYPQFDCAKMTRPSVLLAPHAAPLGLLVYRGAGIAALKDTLLIPYHGYRAQGHRLMAMTLNAQGLPEGEPWQVIWGWNGKPGQAPMGSPVSLAELPDGSVLITEDHNGTLLRLAPLS